MGSSLAGRKRARASVTPPKRAPEQPTAREEPDTAVGPATPPSGLGLQLAEARLQRLAVAGECGGAQQPAPSPAAGGCGSEAASPPVCTSTPLGNSQEQAPPAVSSRSRGPR